MKLLLFALICFLIPIPTKAYIPSYSMILNHLAHFQGRGGYKIEQQVFFKQGAQPIVLNETWLIHKSGRIRLDVMSSKKELKNMYLRFIYFKNKKSFKNENNKNQKQNISNYHLDLPFHLRDKEALHKLFYLWKIAPLNLPEKKQDQGPNFFVNLIRKNGKIQYKINQKKESGTLFIDQDEFIIRSWKWKTGEKLLALSYRLYPGHLFFPSQRVLSDEEGIKVSIKVKKIQHLVLNKKLFYKKKLSKKNKLPQAISVANQDRIREFYKKYR